jgi:hypothetical protein
MSMWELPPQYAPPVRRRYSLEPMTKRQKKGRRAAMRARAANNKRRDALK